MRTRWLPRLCLLVAHSSTSILIHLAFFPMKKIIAHPAPHSEIERGKTTDPYGRPNTWRSPDATCGPQA